MRLGHSTYATVDDISPVYFLPSRDSDDLTLVTYNYRSNVPVEAV